MKFWKYQANGNDFVVFDVRENSLNYSDKELWARICDRKYGVGADGVLFFAPSNDHDFRMIYLNADGGEVDMCGNGARAMVHISKELLGKSPVSFETKKGIYEGEVVSKNKVSVSMNELYAVEEIEISDLYKEAKNSYFANTGVPHCVYEVNDVDEIDVVDIARPIRYDNRFCEGTNINFYDLKDGKIRMRTYERGVEGETLACGTGTVAVALSYRKHHEEKAELDIQTPGGLMNVSFRDGKRFLTGEVTMPFTGSIEL